MWFALQVRTGTEEKIVHMCKERILSHLLKDCFILKYERMHHRKGQWVKVPLPMFPGYLIMVTDEVEKLHMQLKTIPELTKILGDGESFIPIKPCEVEVLEKLGSERHQVEMSLGYIENETIIITDGPMKDMDGRIKKIDRHRRIAVVELLLFGRPMDVTLGLEVVRKS